MAIKYRCYSAGDPASAPQFADELRLAGSAPPARAVDNVRVAAAIRDHAYDVSAAILQRAVRRPEINVGLELIALAFAEHLAAAIAADDWLILLSWVEKTYLRYGGMTVVPRLLVAGAPAVAKTIGALGSGEFGGRVQLGSVSEQIEQIVSRPRISPELVATDTLDEVDVVLGELIERLEVSDPGTAEHSRAVSLWCARIGKRMSLSAAETIFVTRCGLIHDIGKMTTPPEILLAPRRLSAAETNVMRRHAEDGAAIIGAIPLLAPHKPAVRWHHERLDGRGYPDALPAADIPLAARIVSVADSFNAMIGNRPYRLPMRPTAALEELQRHAGTQFDPDVLAAMNDVLTKRT